MKPAHTTLLASALIVAAYIAVPDSANAGGRECMLQSKESKSYAARQVDFDLDAAISVAKKGKSVRREVDALDKSVKGEDFAWLDFPNQCTLQDMMVHELDDLHARASAFRAHEGELLQLQFQIALGRYERAVAEINVAWEKGVMPEDIALKAQYELRVLAFDYLESLGTVSIRERLQEAITELLERGMVAQDRAIARQQFFVKTYTIRLEAALAVLFERSTNGTATAEDLDRISRCLEALERLKKFTTPYDCGT